MKKYKIYLDNCCFNRPFDDQKSLTIYFETQSKLSIQSMIKSGELELVWSFILTAENEANFDNVRKKQIADWRGIAKSYIRFEEEIEIKARQFFNKFNVKPKDAFHIASAIRAKCDFFLTTDKKLINKSKLIEGIIIINPVDFIQDYIEGDSNEK